MHIVWSCSVSQHPCQNEIPVIDKIYYFKVSRRETASSAVGFARVFARICKVHKFFVSKIHWNVDTQEINPEVLMVSGPGVPWGPWDPFTSVLPILPEGPGEWATRKLKNSRWNSNPSSINHSQLWQIWTFQLYSLLKLMLCTVFS